MKKLIQKLKKLFKKKKFNSPYKDEEFSFIDSKRNKKHLIEGVNYEILK